MPYEAPMSAAQRALWFDEQLNPGNPAYHVPVTWRVEGALDLTVLQAALNAVAKRQDALRTSFAQRDHEFVQIVADQVEVPLEVVTAPDNPTQWLREFLRRPFDFSQAPLLRACVIREAKDVHLVTIDGHHIVVDFWSREVLARELSAAYAAELDGAACAELPVVFADFCEWQNEHLQSESFEEDTRYWLALLDEYRGIELPHRQPRPASFQFEGARYAFDVPNETRAAVGAFCRKHRTTPYIVTLAAYNLALARYAGVNDIVVGTPNANRPHGDFNDVVGFFVVVAPARLTFSETDTFLQVVHRLRDQALVGSRKLVPFETLVERLNPPRDPSRNPIFQHALAFQNVPRSTFDIAGARTERQEVDAGVSMFDMTSYVYDVPDGMHGLIEYATDLFDPSFVEQFVATWLAILQEGVAQADQPLGQLRLLDQSHVKMLEQWAQGPRHTVSTNALAAIYSQCRDHPNKVAVQQTSTTWTYKHLWSQVLTVANALRNAGVQSGDVVGVCTARTPSMIAATLGCWQAGAAYLPLDPNYPKKRTEWVIEDSGIKVCVVDETTQQTLAESGVATFTIPQLEDSAAAGAATPLAANALAYLIYTSGSTGQPKGVRVTHGNVANFLVSMRQSPGCEPDARLLGVTTLSFDIAVLELYLPLTTGAQVILAEEADIIDGRRLAKLISDHEVTLMQATPSTWQMLMQADLNAQSLRALCGGEPLPQDLAERLVQRVGELWNMYGPTETTVWSTIKRVKKADLNIGRPIHNTRVHVLDGELRPLPPGAIGELFIGGDGVAEGYHNRPDLSASRFVQSPWLAGDEVLYRTGDYARFSSTGELECLGRTDDQVKVRGFRIELGEVETALARLDGIERAAAVATPTALTVYYTANVDLSPIALRKHISRELPSYMLPQSFQRLDSFPQTPNGKVDRQALSRLSNVALPEKQVVPPQSAAETYLATTWQNLVEHPAPIDRHANFFEVGGHSLLALELAMHIEAERGISIPVRALVSQQLFEIAEQYLDREPAAPAAAGKHSDLFKKLRRWVSR